MLDPTGSKTRSTPQEALNATLATALVRQAPTLVGMCDAQLRPCFLNEAGRQMVGLSGDADLSAYAITDFFTADQRAFVEEVALPTMLRDGRWEGELHMRHFADPRRQTEVRWSAFALRDEAGDLTGAATFTSDISARKRAEGALREQQRLLSSVLDNLPLGVGVYGGDGQLVHSNERMRDYTGLTQLPSRDGRSSQHWRGFDADGAPIPPQDYPGARALRGETVTPGLDFLYRDDEGSDRWMRVSAIPFCRGDGAGAETVVVLQDVDDLKKAAERIEAAGAVLAAQTRFLEATLSSIPDFVCAFDRQRRFVYANAAVLGLFGLTADEMLGKTFADLDYPPELADRLNRHIDHILAEGVQIEDEVFFRSPTGRAAYFGFLWGPVRAEDGSVELVVGVSRDNSERRSFEEKLGRSEARLRAATELVGLGIYSWDPVTGALDWDDRLRAMWGLPPDAEVDNDVWEAGIHPDDLPRVRSAVAACADPAGDGRYNLEYRVTGRDDGITRHIATSGRTTFVEGRAVDFIGAAIEVTAQRRAEAAMRASHAQFRSFAEHSSNLIWIVDPAADAVIYRSAAFERIWGVPREEAPTAIVDWMKDVHPDDLPRVKRTLESVKRGEAAQLEYRIVRPGDGAVRYLRDTSFPIFDDSGALARIGGITEDRTRDDARQVYVVSARAAEARRLATLVRGVGYHVRTFDSAAAFLDVAAVLAPGCVLVDLRQARDSGLSIPRELKARAMALPTIALDAPDAGVAAAVAAMRAGATDYLIAQDEPSLRSSLAGAMAECRGAVRPATRNESADGRLARLTPREREVLVGLVEGGTNKLIAQKLGISPRTVELHRAQVMSRLDAGSLTEMLQVAMAAGIAPSAGEGRKSWQPT